MLADNWDRGSLYSYRAFSFPSEMPYEAIKQPVMFITGEKDGALTKGAKKVRVGCLFRIRGRHQADVALVQSSALVAALAESYTSDMFCPCHLLPSQLITLYLCQIDTSVVSSLIAGLDAAAAAWSFSSPPHAGVRPPAGSRELQE